VKREVWGVEGPKGPEGGRGSKWGSFQRGTLNITFNVLTYLGAALRHKEGWVRGEGGAKKRQKMQKSNY